MRILFLCDVVGRSGRTAIAERLPKLRERWRLDFVVVNAENASNGAGCTAAHAQALLNAGADVLTLGDHAFDQKDMLQAVESDPRIIRPLNIAKAAPGVGVRAFQVGNRKVVVAQALGQVFMKNPYADPFSALDGALRVHRLGAMADVVIVDLHAEATSEKVAMGHFLDGRASLVVGTHTHVPTGDAMILPNGTAYLTDAGMCGDYRGVIGMTKDEPLRRFVTGLPKGRFEPGGEEATLSGVYVETGAGGRATRVVPVREGPVLAPSGPD